MFTFNWNNQTLSLESAAPLMEEDPKLVAYLAGVKKALAGEIKVSVMPGRFKSYGPFSFCAVARLIRSEIAVAFLEGISRGSYCGFLQEGGKIDLTSFAAEALEGAGELDAILWRLKNDVALSVHWAQKCGIARHLADRQARGRKARRVVDRYRVLDFLHPIAPLMSIDPELLRIFGEGEEVSQTS